MKIQLSPDWNEFLSLLISKRVRFLLVGGHAVAAHGEPRLTEDLDVFVDPARANAGRLREALLAFGFGASLPSVRELAVPGKIWMLGRKPWRIDVLTQISGVTFDEAWKDHVNAMIEGDTPTYVISRENLIKNKLAAGREQDILDVKQIKKAAAYAPEQPKQKAKKPIPKKEESQRH